MIKTEEKNYLNEVAKNNKNEKYQPKKIETEVADLSKSRVKQLLQLKEEAEYNQDFDKLKIIESELFLMRS
jgi:hypothetical protein